MPYDELINRLRECTAEQNGEKTLWHQAADAIDELSHIQIAPEKIIQTMWIPVTERLPEGGDESGQLCENVILLLSVKYRTSTPFRRIILQTEYKVNGENTRYRLFTLLVTNLITKYSVSVKKDTGSNGVRNKSERQIKRGQRSGIRYPDREKENRPGQGR